METPKQHKKALIVTYYWPPSGGSPVLRWLKFVKYLPEFGWEPFIYTPSNPVPQAIDNSLLYEVPQNLVVYSHVIREPANAFGFKKNKQGKVLQSTAFINTKSRKSFLSEIAVWIRGNFFIPDARMLWVRPSVKFLTKIIRTEGFDVIITTGPPHSMHLIGLGVKKKTGIPWVADFRDPWTNIDFYNQLKLTPSADQKHRRLEQKVLKSADAVITVSPTLSSEFEQISGRPVNTITNGFDEVPAESPESITRFKILHVGSMPSSRNPEKLWEVLGELNNELAGFSGDLEIELIGNVDYSILNDIDAHGLTDNLLRRDHIPNQEAIKTMQGAAVLLLVINNSQNAKGILTNKFFEYLSVKRPILAIGPVDGDASQILMDSESGKIVGYDDKENLKQIVKLYYFSYKENELSVNSSGIEKYSRRNLTRVLAHLLDKITG